MLNMFAPLFSLISRFLPYDLFLPTRFFIAKAIFFSFLAGYLFSFLFNFLLGRAYRSLRSWLKEKRRNRRLQQNTVPNGELVGEVTSFLSHLKVAVIKVINKDVRVGDTILIKGNQTKLMLPVRSLQINRQPVEIVKKGTEAGLLVGKKVSRNDLVFKINK